MFKKGGVKTNSIIGKGTEFKGVFKDKESIRIDGKFEGEIQTEGVVIIGEEALIRANIKAKSVSIRGRVIGDVNCQGKVELFSSGNLEGKVKTSNLIIAEGAFFNGECRMMSLEEKSEEDLEEGAQEATQKEAAEQRTKITDERILSVIQKSPEGITLPEIGERLGVHYVTISGRVKDLVEQGKVRKEDKRYFSIPEK